MAFERFVPAAILIAALVAGVAAAGASSPAVADEALTAAQKEAVEKIVRDFLRNNPEAVIEALQAVKEKQEEEGKQRLRDTIALKRDELLNDAASPVGGNPQGNVTVVEFFDYRCAYCKRMMAPVLELLRSDKNVRFVFKEFPILGPESLAASRAALAAWRLDRSRYVALHTALMDNRGNLSSVRILEIAAGVGFDKTKLEQAMADPTIDEALRRNFALAESLKISGTPAFVIGAEIVPGAVELEALRTLVAEARKG